MRTSSANRILYETREKIQASRYQLADYAEATEIHLTNDEVRLLAQQDAQAAIHNPTMLIAVVGSRDLVYCLLRMWEMYADSPGFETRVFRMVEDAQAWLHSKLGGSSETIRT